MPQMVPNDGTSQLLPSHTSMGRDTVTQNLQHRARRLSLPFPHAIKQFSKGKQQKAEQFLISYTLAALLYIAECCSTQWISICKHLPAPPAEQIISASAFGTQTTTFFLFHGGKRLQPFDFKHRHPSGLSSRKSVSPRLQIDMFVCRVTLLIRRFSFRHKKCLLVKLQQPIKFQA